MKVKVELEYLSYEEEYVRQIMKSAQRDISYYATLNGDDEVAEQYKAAYPWLKIDWVRDEYGGGYLYRMESTYEGVQRLICKFRV